MTRYATLLYADGYPATVSEPWPDDADPVQLMGEPDGKPVGTYCHWSAGAGRVLAITGSPLSVLDYDGVMCWASEIDGSDI